jgi:hypothetical protein
MNCRHQLMQRLDGEGLAELLEDASGKLWACHGPSSLPQDVQRRPRSRAFGSALFASVTFGAIDSGSTSLRKCAGSYRRFRVQRLTP